MSRSLLHEWEHDIVKYSINVGEMMKVAKDIYDTAYARGKANEKTGRWYIRETYPLECESWECSECKEVVFEKTRFCPNCGTRMVSE